MSDKRPNTTYNKHYQEVDSSKLITRGVKVNGDTQRDFDRAFRTFNKKMQDSGLVKEIRARGEYIKPSEKKQIAKKAARNRTRRENAQQYIKPQY